MTKISEAFTFGLTIRESATDGSDFTNPAADYRRLFLGEDGALHLKDSAGAVTTAGSAAGTSFPGAPATGERYFRTDRGIEYYYDGTRWLSAFQRTLPIDCRTAQVSGISSTVTVGNAVIPGSDIFIESMRVAAFASGSGSFDGSNYWTFTLDKLTTANVATNVATVTANSQSLSEWKLWTATANALVQGSAHIAFRLIATKTGTPANLFFGSEITYRLVG